MPSWERHAIGQGTEVSTINWEMVRTGRTPYGEWKLPTPRHRIPKFYWNSAVKMLVFDEVHRAMTYDSKNSELVIAARRQRIPTLALSATAADNPLELNSLGYLLGLHDGIDPVATLRRPEPDSFLNWARRHGCRKGPRHELEFAGDSITKAEIMARIHAAIYPDKGVRIRIADLGDEFPETSVTSDIYSLGDADKITEIESLMERPLAVLAETIAGDKYDTALVELLRMRQEVELMKVPGLVECAKEDEAAGRNVAIFVNFTATIDAICDQLGTQCRIHGGIPAIVREQNRLNFQANYEHFLVCNGDAAGLGLDAHDLRGRPRSSRIFPGFNAKQLQQILGRIHRAGSLSKSLQYIMLADTPSERAIHLAIQTKLACGAALNDGTVSLC